MTTAASAARERATCTAPLNQAPLHPDHRLLRRGTPRPSASGRPSRGHRSRACPGPARPGCDLAGRVDERVVETALLGDRADLVEVRRPLDRQTTPQGVDALVLLDRARGPIVARGPARRRVGPADRRA